jgi:polyisoprenoid-binding protein YceI
MKRIAFSCAVAIGALATAGAQDMGPPPGGEYKLDKMHASLTFTISHIGFSNYTAGFGTFDATMTFDPTNAGISKLTATVDPKSLDLVNPPPGFVEELTGKNWLDAATYPEMKFVSTAVEVTGEKTGKVTGDFTMHGVTKPVTLEVTYNGGYPGFADLDPKARVGFSAKGTLKRSEFGVTAGLPPPGTTMGVSDEIKIIIEAEFNGPPLKK